MDSQVKNNDTRVKPFLGTHTEHETKRFDKMNMRPYKPAKMALAPTMKIMNLASELNK